MNRIPVLKTYKIYIDGAFPRSESGRSFVFKDRKGAGIANMCHSSKKDFRNAVVAARGAQGKWGGRSGYNRGQILYRIAEMVEGRSEQFVAELVQEGGSKAKARSEVAASVDRLITFAGWADKFQQVFSTVNPVASSHFVFSLPEPTGVVAIAGPAVRGLLGLVSCISPVILGGNTCVVLVDEHQPMSAITFAEVLVSSDLPPGVVNILTGFRSELLEQMSGHMDVNAFVYCGTDEKEKKLVQEQASLNLKRVVVWEDRWSDPRTENPFAIMQTQDVKTTWHPVGL